MAEAEKLVVQTVFFTVIVFALLAFLVFMSSSLEKARLYCESKECGPATELLIDIFRMALEVIALPVSVMVVIMAVLLLSVMIIVQTVVWAVVTLFTNPAGLVLVLVACTIYLNHLYA